MTDTKSPDSQPGRKQREWLEHIEEALKGLRYGEVRIVVQDGVVIQIDRTERKRLDKG